MIDRRQFVSRCFKAGALAAFSGWVPGASGLTLLRSAFGAGEATAPLDQRKFFVMIRAKGGWDVTLGLDPWTEGALPDERDLFIEYRPEDVLRALDLNLGPACAPIVPFAPNLIPIRGMLVSDSDNGHTAALDYVCTGNGQGRSPDLPVELALAGKSGPMGVIATNRVYLADRRATVHMTDGILNTRDNEDPAELISELVGSRSGSSALLDAQRALLLGSGESRVMLEKLQVYEDGLEDGESITGRHVIASAFAAGAANHAALTLNGFSLDTHANHEKQHLEAQTGAWKEVAGIFDLFKSVPLSESGVSLFDRTLFVVVSEFSRTPVLNGAKGKDHNPLLNSALLAGGLVRGGYSVGGSRLITRARSKTRASYHMAAPIDFRTGEVLHARGNADFILPENLVKTVARMMDADTPAFRSVPRETRVIPGVISG